MKYMNLSMALIVNDGSELKNKFPCFRLIELPRGGPHIQGYRRQIVAGESIRLNCTSLKSRPAAELYFLINDRYIKVFLKFYNFVSYREYSYNKNLIR